MIDGDFSLVDHNGVRVSRATYTGKFVVVFFGFSHCKVVCPRALDRLTRVLGALGPAAERVQPLYITVDPRRDTPDVLRNFLAARAPAFVGLTGSEAEIESAKRSYRVFSARRDDPEEPDGYAMPHSAFTYLMSPEGTFLRHFPDHLPEEAVIAGLREAMA